MSVAIGHPQSKAPGPITPVFATITNFTGYTGPFPFLTGTFYVSQTGSYSANLLSPMLSNGVYILKGSFSPSTGTPSTPLSNFIVFRQALTDTTVNVQLEAGVEYSYVAIFSGGSSPVTFTVSGPGDVCFGSVGICKKAATASAIGSFLSSRGNAIMSAGPDTSMLHARLSGGSVVGGNDAGASVPGAGYAATALAPLSGATSARVGLGEQGIGPSGPGGTLGAGAVGFDPLDQFRTTRSRFGGSMFGSPVSPSSGFEGVALGWVREYDADRGSGQTGTLPFFFSGMAEGNTGSFAFSTSLVQMRQAAAAEEARKRASIEQSDSAIGAGGELKDGDATKLALASSSGISRTMLQSPYNFWVQGSSSYFVNELPGSRYSGHATIAMAGADYLLMPGVLAGVMVQTDWMDQGSNVSTSVSGFGWMAGPYVSARLTPNIYFDMRVLGGRSSNQLDTNGSGAATVSDDFSTERLLASAKITGVYGFGAWRIRPSAELIYFTDRQKAFISSRSGPIEDQEFSVGRLNVGPEIGYRMHLADKTVFEPFVALTGIWDFARSDETTVAGIEVGREGLRGRVDAGLTFHTPSGIMVRGMGGYDGIGSSDYHAFQGRGSVVIPLQ